MRYLILCIALAGCVTAPAQPPKVINECSWVQPMTASEADTKSTKREIIAYEIARQKNCPPKN